MLPPALNGIRSYHKAGNMQAELTIAMSKIQSIVLTSKLQKNARVLDAFRKSAMADRQFTARE